MYRWRRNVLMLTAIKNDPHTPSHPSPLCSSPTPLLLPLPQYISSPLRLLPPLRTPPPCLLSILFLPPLHHLSLTFLPFLFILVLLFFLLLFLIWGGVEEGKDEEEDEEEEEVFVIFTRVIKTYTQHRQLFFSMEGIILGKI